MNLFSLVINPVLEAVSSMDIPPFMLGNSPVQVLAYADDIALIANNNHDLQSMINKAVFVTEKSGMVYRPDKCAYLQFPERNKNTEVYIKETPLKKLKPKEFYMYLGVPIGINYDQTPYDTLKKLVSDTNKILDSDLHNWQKLKAFKFILYPRLIYSFRTREIKTTFLSVKNSKNNNQSNVSSKLRSALRRMLNLPKNSEVCYLYSSTDNGGAGLNDLRDEYSIQSIVQAFRLLNSKCSHTKQIISDSLCFTAASRLNVDFADLSSALTWLTTGNNKGNILSKKSWWFRVKRAIGYLEKNHNFSIFFEILQNSIAIRITSNIRGTCILTSVHRNICSKVLHTAVEDSYFNKWQNSKLSNFITDTVISSQLNKIIFRGDIGNFAWNFIHRARTNTIPVNARPMNKNPESRLCRRCHSTAETLSHAIQSCNSIKTLSRQRHDACLKLICDYISSPNLIIVIDRTCPKLLDSRERVDLRITDVEKKIIYLIDMKCPIDSKFNFERTDKDNLEKYSSLKSKIQLAKPDFRVELFTCMIGSLGSIPQSSLDIFKLLGLSDFKI